MARPVEEAAMELRQLGCDADEEQLKAVASALVAGERILAVLFGQSFGSRNRNELVVQTDQQVLICHIWHSGGWFGSALMKFNHYFWQDIRNVTLKGGSIGVDINGSDYGAVAIFAPGAIAQDRLEKFLDGLQERVAAVKSGAKVRASGQLPSQSGSMGLLEQLERLANLRERGHLSHQEFETAKKKLLE